MSEAIEAQARAFAEDLTRTVSALVPDVSPFSARALTSGARQRFAVRQEPDTGVPLLVDGQALLTLKVKYECALDGVERYLAVDESLFWVFAGDPERVKPCET